MKAKVYALFFALVLSAGVQAEPLSASALAAACGRTLVMLTHPAEPNKLWAGTAQGGLWQSADGGNSWTLAAENTQGLAVTTIMLHPLNPNIIYVGTAAGDKPNLDTRDRGIFKSEDGGKSWALLALTNPAVVGASWGQINHIAISTTGVLLVATADKERNGFIYRSSDGGETWGLFPVYVASKIGPRNTIHKVKFDPDNPNGAIFMDNYANITLSSDGGRTWELVRKSTTCK